MSAQLIIGEWLERDAREFDRCPSYYAADTETLRVKPGRYPARVEFVGGYTVPMPQWLLVAIDCERVSGALYSGYGGVNYSRRELPPGEPVSYGLQWHAYGIAQAVADGRLVLRPGFEWLASECAFKHPDAPKTWEAVAALAAAQS